MPRPTALLPVLLLAVPLLALPLLATRLAAPARAELLETPDLAVEGDWTLHLELPEGVGPHPLVVFLPGCEGWGPWERQSAASHAKALAGAGWGLAALDVLGPRGIDGICSDNAGLEGLRDDAAAAASAAAAQLAKDPRVDGGRLVFMGQSFGGSVALDLASPHRRKLAGIAAPFAAVVAYYPWCYDNYGMGTKADFDTPVLVLAGGADEWTPASRCLSLQEAQQARGEASPFLVEVYPGAHHSFDLDRMPRYEIAGVTGTQVVAGNPEAAAASRRRYLDWLAETLP